MNISVFNGARNEGYNNICSLTCYIQAFSYSQPRSRDEIECFGTWGERENYTERERTGKRVLVRFLSLVGSVMKHGF